MIDREKTSNRNATGQIGMPQVTYLGHVFCAAGVTPDETKVKAVVEWPTGAVHQLRHAKGGGGGGGRGSEQL